MYGNQISNVRVRKNRGVTQLRTTVSGMFVSKGDAACVGTGGGGGGVSSRRLGERVGGQAGATEKRDSRKDTGAGARGIRRGYWITHNLNNLVHSPQRLKGDLAFRRRAKWSFGTAC